MLALAVVGVVGCRTSPPTAVERWRGERSYYALLEILDEAIDRRNDDVAKNEVRALLGDPADEWRTSERTWFYPSSRRGSPPRGHLLFIHFDDDGNLESFEWAAE